MVMKYQKMKIDRIQKIYFDLLYEYSAKIKIGGYSSISESSKDNATKSSISHDKYSKLMSNFDLFIASIETEKETTSTELDYYLEERLIPRKGDFDVLS